MDVSSVSLLIKLYHIIVLFFNQCFGLFTLLSHFIFKKGNFILDKGKKYKNNRQFPVENCRLLVEPRRVELLSENPSTRPSTSVADVLEFPPSSPQRQGQAFGSFIKSHLRQSLRRLVPHIDDARDPGRGQPGTDGHCLSSDGYEIRFVSCFLIPAFNEARGFGSLIRLQRSPSKPFTAPLKAPPYPCGALGCTRVHLA